MRPTKRKYGKNDDTSKRHNFLDNGQVKVRDKEGSVVFRTDASRSREKWVMRVSSLRGGETAKDRDRGVKRASGVFDVETA